MKAGVRRTRGAALPDPGPGLRERARFRACALAPGRSVHRPLRAAARARVPRPGGRAEGVRGRPPFAALQESIYGSGANGPTAWAAERERAAHPGFREDARPLLFTGEIMYPWMFEEIRALRPFRPAVDLVAAREEWPALYDPGRLAANEVPVVAAVYFDDMFVDSGLQLRTAAAVGNLRTWVTNEYEHDGLAQDGRVFGRLVEVLDEAGGGLGGGWPR